MNKFNRLVKNKKDKSLIILFVAFNFLLTFALPNTRAQNIDVLEAKYFYLLNLVQNESLKLDSLKTILDLKAKAIDNEKMKSGNNKKKIVELMANTVIISNQIDLRQKKLQQVQGDFEAVKAGLNKRYTSIIDSLNQLLRSGKNSNYKDKVKEEILKYTEKRLFVAPKISLLSYYPDQIIGIDLGKIKNPEEKAMYEQYVNDALNEVSSLLDNVNELSGEVNQIIELQKKTNKFLEETEFESSLNPLGSPKSRPQARATISLDSKNNFSLFESQAQIYTLLLTQLNFRPPTGSKNRLQIRLDEKQKSISLPDYLNLLKEVKKRLIDYKAILKHKIETAG